MEEFDTLNEKIIKAEVNDEEVKRFDELAFLYARQEAEKFELPESKQKELIEKHWNQCGDKYRENINATEDFILETSENHQFPIEYLWG